MSELGFTGKIPIPNLTKFGDLSGEIGKQQALDMQRGALDQKRKAAQAKQATERSANAAALQAQMGGLYKDVHPFALQFVEQAYDELTQEVLPFMYMENGADLAKPLIENFKASVDRYAVNRDMIKKEGDLAAMIDPNSPQALSANSDLGDFYKAVSSPEILDAAQEYQYRGIMQGAQLDYKQGRFDINGLAYDPSTGVATSMSELSMHPRFNNENSFNPQTQMVSPMDLIDFGHDIRDIEKGSNRPWSADRISKVGVEGGYGGYYQGYLDFNSVNKEGNIPYKWRQRAFLDAESHLREVNRSAKNMSQDELFAFFQLNPKDKGDNPALWDMAKVVMDEAWSSTLTHSVYVDDEESDKGQKAQNMLSTSNVAQIKTNNLPTDPSGLGLYNSVAYTEGAEQTKRAAYEVTNLSAKTMENLVVPAFDNQFFKDAQLYKDLGMIDFDQRGMPIPGPKLQNASEQVQAGIANLLAKGDAVKKSTIQDIVFYKDNPNLIGVITTDGREITMDPNNLNWYTQPIHTAIQSGLQKETGLTIEKLWEDAHTKYFVGGTTSNDPLNLFPTAPTEPSDD